MHINFKEFHVSMSHIVGTTISLPGEAPRALAWWLGLMTPDEEVVGSIPHAGVVLTIIVHPTMVGGLGPCCMGTSKSEVPKYPRQALHLSCSEAMFGGGGVKPTPYLFN